MTRARDVANIDGILTTTGDTYYASAAATPARLGIGSTGNILTVSGGLPVWSAPAAGGGMTLIATGTGTGSSATITFSSIPSTYKHLMIVFEEVRTATGGASVSMKFNANSANYDFRFSGTDTTNDWAASIMYTLYSVGDAIGTSAYANGVMWVNDYSGSQTNKTGTGLWAYGYSGGGSNGYRTGTFRWRNTAAISSIDIGNAGGGNFGTATVIKLYGVS